MLGLGWGEITLIAALLLVFVGPADLPKLLRFLGRSYGKLRRSSDDLRRTFTLEVDRVDAEARAEEIQRRREALIARRKEESERIKEVGGPFPRSEKLPTSPPSTGPYGLVNNLNGSPQRTVASYCPAGTLSVQVAFPSTWTKVRSRSG